MFVYSRYKFSKEDKKKRTIDIDPFSFPRAPAVDGVDTFSVPIQDRFLLKSFLVPPLLYLSLYIWDESVKDQTAVSRAKSQKGNFDLAFPWLVLDFYLNFKVDKGIG